MTYLARGYLDRGYLDSSLGRTESGAPPAGDDLAGTDTLTFSETGTLSTSLRANDTLTFAGTGTTLGAAILSADPDNPETKVKFSEIARLSAEVAVTAPPSGTVFIKRVSPTMPAPVLDSRGRPT